MVMTNEKVGAWYSSRPKEAMSPFEVFLSTPPPPLPSPLEGATLRYFPLPGRGEHIRLALVLAGVKEWTDERVQMKDWPALKQDQTSTPWGAMPLLELSDGTVLAQARAILRFVGTHAGIYPTSSSLLALRCDELMDVIDDLQSTTNAVGAGMEKAEKEAARAEAVRQSQLHCLLSQPPPPPLFAVCCACLTSNFLSLSLSCLSWTRPSESKTPVDQLAIVVPF
jgi:hypothetical protein